MYHALNVTIITYIMETKAIFSDLNCPAFTKKMWEPEEREGALEAVHSDDISFNVASRESVS
jgi:hypothetical protein